MKSYLSFAIKELKSQKKTSILIIFAIILSTIMSTVIGQSIGVLQQFRISQAITLNGNRYATFHMLTKKQRDILSYDERLTDIGSFVNLGETEITKSGLTLYIREYHGDSLAIYPSATKIQEGRLPEKPLEIALPEDVLQYLKFSGNIGDTISINAQVSLRNDKEPPFKFNADFTLCGILDGNYIGYINGIVEGIAGEGSAQLLLPERYQLFSTDFKTKSRASFQETVKELSEELDVAEENIQYNYLLLKAQGIPYNDENNETQSTSGFSFMTVACIVVGLLTFLAAGLVIYNILKISITKKIKEYGILRSIGSTKIQLFKIVARQLLILFCIGTPIGATIGMLLSDGALSATVSFFNPELFMLEPTQTIASVIGQNSGNKIFPLFFSILITLVFVIIAALPSAYFAARVSPVASISQRHLGRIKRKRRKYSTIHNFEAFFARLNLNRNRTRTLITIISIAMSISVFVALQAFSNILDASVEIKKKHVGDYSITSETIGMTQDIANALSNNENVQKISSMKTKIYWNDEESPLPADINFSIYDWETLQIVGLDEERLLSLQNSLKEIDQKDVMNGTGCFVVNSIETDPEHPSTIMMVDDEIVINKHIYRIVGIIDEPLVANNDAYYSGLQIIVTSDDFEAITGETKYTELYATLTHDANREQFETFLTELCEKNEGCHWLSFKRTDEQLSKSGVQIKALCWGLILLISLIGIINIINTVYTNIHTRVQEIGIQRAIGMSKTSLYKTFLWEGVYYGLIAMCVGGVMGYTCAIIVNAVTLDELQLTLTPLASIIEAGIISVGICIVATAIPLRAISKLNIIDAIAAID